jgi:hypothetical protein
MTSFMLPNTSSVTGMATILILCLCLLSLMFVSFASHVEFDRIDVASPDFDVDWGESPEHRWIRLKEFASTPLKGWNSYDGWDWVTAVTAALAAAHLTSRRMTVSISWSTSRLTWSHFL